MPMLRKRFVVDSNFLRDPKFDAFLARHPLFQIIVCEDVVAEMMKGDPIKAIPASMSILLNRRSRFSVLRPTSEVSEMGVRPVRVKELIDGPGKKYLLDLHRLSVDAANGNKAANASLQQARPYYLRRSDRFGDHRGWWKAFDAGSNVISKEHLAEARKDGPYSDELVRELIGGSARVIRLLSVPYSANHSVRSPADIIDSFLFRYVLCLSIIRLRWIAHGRQTTSSYMKVRNDLIDATIIAFASMFDGLLTQDVRMNRIYGILITTLKGGARTILKYIMLSRIQKGVSRWTILGEIVSRRRIDTDEIFEYLKSESELEEEASALTSS